MYILAIDQGTTGTRAVLYNKQGKAVASAYKEFRQICPKPGWVEHDPEEIWQTVVKTIREVLKKKPGKVLAIGITNQRETTVIWDRKTGKPIHNAIVWQCRRTAQLCDIFKQYDYEIREKTGLPVDAYFSATKIMWLLQEAYKGSIKNLLFGTIDTWLLWKLTGGQVHATDYTNASRTLLYNISEKGWDEELLNLFGISRSILPDVMGSMDDYGKVQSIRELKGVPVLAMAGDQQAALFGQNCFGPGQVKNTYGTGNFMVMNTGSKFVKTRQLITTLAVGGDGTPCYALEGSMFVAGAAIQWLRDELGLLKKAADSEKMALKVPDNAGVYLVPAFTGLGAPHWDMSARGAVVGVTRGAGKNHIVRAALEAMAYQSSDVLEIMEKESGSKIDRLMVDGGAVANNFLMQFQADIIGRPVLRPSIIESTSLGVALMAGIKAGLWAGSAQVKKLKKYDRVFKPEMQPQEQNRLLSGWHKALRQVRAS